MQSQAFRVTYWAAVRAETRARARACRQMGIRRTRFLSAKERTRCNTLNDLFSDVRLYTGKSERDIFFLAFPLQPEKAEKWLFRFIRDVRTCPRAVQKVAQSLRAQSIRALHTRDAAERNRTKGIASTQ